MRIDMVSEHASPLAVLGGVDAGGQNVHVAALACALARRGARVVVHTRRDDERLPERVALAPGVTVATSTPGRRAPCPRTTCSSTCRPSPRSSSALGATIRPTSCTPTSGCPGTPRCSPRATARCRSCRPSTLSASSSAATRATTTPRRRSGSGIERDIVRRADEIVATCTDEVFELVRLGAARDRLTVVPCGVDLTRFTPDGPREPRTPGRRRLVSVGPPGPAQGHRQRHPGARAAARHGARRRRRTAAGASSAATRGRPVARIADAARRRRPRGAARPRRARRLPGAPALGRRRRVRAVVRAVRHRAARGHGLRRPGRRIGGRGPDRHGRRRRHRRARPPARPGALRRGARALLDDPERRAAFGRAGVRRARRRYNWDRVAGATLESTTAARSSARRPRAGASACDHR